MCVCVCVCVCACVCGGRGDLLYSCLTVCIHRSKLGKKNVTVAITPNGYADAVEGKFFVTPHYQVMKMELFLNILRGIFPKNLEGVYYIQKQNSNFIEEFNEIHRDAMMEIPWANEAFGE